jgi:hypothetical protein
LFKTEAVLPAIHARLRTELLRTLCRRRLGRQRKRLPQKSRTALAGKLKDEEAGFMVASS